MPEQELIPIHENIKKIHDRISVLEVKSQITHKKLDSLTLDVKIAEQDTRKDIMQFNSGGGWKQLFYNAKKTLQSGRPILQKKGVEPSRYCYHTDLNRARLPIPPLLHLSYLSLLFSQAT